MLWSHRCVCGGGVGWAVLRERSRVELVQSLLCKAMSPHFQCLYLPLFYSESQKVAFLKWLIPAWKRGYFHLAILMSLLGGEVCYHLIVYQGSTCEFELCSPFPCHDGANWDPLKCRKKINLCIPHRSSVCCRTNNEL